MISAFGVEHGEISKAANKKVLSYAKYGGKKDIVADLEERRKDYQKYKPKKRRR